MVKLLMAFIVASHAPLSLMKGLLGGNDCQDPAHQAQISEKLKTYFHKLIQLPCYHANFNTTHRLCTIEIRKPTQP